VVEKLFRECLMFGVRIATLKQKWIPIKTKKKLPKHGTNANKQERKVRMSSLGTELPKEIERNQELLGIYKEIGTPGLFAATMIKSDIKEAIDVLASGDCVRMIQVYEKLKANQ